MLTGSVTVGSLPLWQKEMPLQIQSSLDEKRTAVLKMSMEAGVFGCVAAEQVSGRGRGAWAATL